MRVRPLAPFGAEMEGLALGDATAADVACLAEALSCHRLLVCRHQQGGDAALVHFLRQLGDLTFTEGEQPVAGAPDLNLVSNQGRSRPPRSVFHSDTSYVPRPPAIGALRLVAAPTGGGDTLFSDQVRAAATLPAKVRACLVGRSLLHQVRLPDGDIRSCRHPLLRRHPDSGDTILFLSTPERLRALSGATEAASARIVDLLYRHSIRAAHLYRHQWRPGDVLLWDNRATLHRADHSQVVGARILHRGLVLGEPPAPADLR